MRLLVLGGTRFVGRAVVAGALASGWDVTAVHRGVTGTLPPGVDARLADRTDGAALAGALGADRWDAVLDTWQADPAVAALAADLLRDRVGAAACVSSRSVYAWGSHVDERSPLTDVPGYPSDKLGGERAWQSALPQALLLRAGLVLGPHEDVGRLPWWLGRVARGGPVLAPGRPERPLQWVDARDLAAFALSGLAGGLAGAYDVTCRSGQASTLDLLEACVDVTGSDAELVWVDEQALDAAGVEGWTQLPCWVPESGDSAGFLEGDVTRALGAGLECRPLEETVADTWRWLQADGWPPPRTDRPPVGLPPELERQLLGPREQPVAPPAPEV